MVGTGGCLLAARIPLDIRENLERLGILRFTGSSKQDIGSEPFPDSRSISLTEVREGKEQS
jgi:hypothetical protein